MCRILFAAKHSWMALRMSRPLFVGSWRSRGGLLANEKKENLLRMIIHLVCPPKLCISIVFNSSWDHCNTQEKLKTKGLYFLCGRGGQTRCIMGEVVIANRSCCRIISTNEVQMLERGSSGKMTPINNF